MRQINIALDLYSALICAILYFHLSAVKRNKDRSRACFKWMCAFNFGMTAGDIPAWACQGYGQPWYPAAQWLGAVVFWLCSTLLLLAFTAYLIEYLSPKVRVHKALWYAAILLSLLHIGGTFLSLWNGMFFTIAEGNIYQRGDWFWLSQAIPFLIYVLDITIFVFYRRGLSRKDFSILSGYIALPLLAEIVQMLNFGVGLLSAAVSLSLLFIFVNIQSAREIRQEKELSDARISIMLSQIQPHFLYNALTTIRRLCDDDPKQAKAAIRDFSLFLRGNMDSLSSSAPIPFEQELKHTVNYLNLEQQRFQSRLRVIYEITATDFSIPPLTLQPIVENAVRHGVLRREEGGTVTVRTEESDYFYQIIVQDDGVGFAGAADIADGQRHVGISNVRERLAALCGGTLVFQSAKGIGTTAKITIPKEVERS